MYTVPYYRSWVKLAASPFVAYANAAPMPKITIGRPDLSVRQPAAEGAAETVAREAPGGRALGHYAGPELHLRASEPGHQEV